MRVAVIGQGSIGRRHTAILLELGHEVVVFDPDSAVSAADGAARATTFDDAIDGVDAAVVASPSVEHPGQARRALEQSVPLMVEKPLALDPARAAELEWLARERGVVLAVAMNLRQMDGVLALRDLIGEGVLGGVLQASAWCGSWLPGWRPDSDYRRSYSASAAAGGGVLLDVAVHELDYLLWLLGPATSVSALGGRRSSLEIDVDDFSLMALELASGTVADLSVNYFDRSYHRGCRLVGDHASAHWDWEHERLTISGTDAAPTEREVPSDVSSAYRRQLERFMSAVSGGDQPVPTAGEARRVLAVIDACRRSARDGTRVTVAPDIGLREAATEDRDRLLAWRNDPETRRWSRVQDPVSSDEHDRWLARTLTDPDATLWIAEANGSPIGQVRVTREGSDALELHTALAPEVRRRGLAAAVLTEAAARALTDSGVDRLVAHVKDANTLSLRAFTRAGFQSAGHDAAGLIRLERPACR